MGQTLIAVYREWVDLTIGGTARGRIEKYDLYIGFWIRDFQGDQGGLARSDGRETLNCLRPWSALPFATIVLLALPNERVRVMI